MNNGYMPYDPHNPWGSFETGFGHQNRMNPSQQQQPLFPGMPGATGQGAMNNQPTFADTQPWMTPQQIYAGAPTPTGIGNNNNSGWPSWFSNNAQGLGAFGDTMAGLGSIFEGVLGYGQFKESKKQSRKFWEGWEKNYAAQLAEYDRSVADKANARAGYDRNFDAEAYKKEHSLG